MYVFQKKFHINYAKFLRSQSIFQQAPPYSKSSLLKNKIINPSNYENKKKYGSNSSIFHNLPAPPPITSHHSKYFHSNSNVIVDNDHKLQGQNKETRSRKQTKKGI